MSFWQCPACVRESYFCDKTHLKLHLMSEHNISGRTLSKIIEGLTPAFEESIINKKEVSESEIKLESKLQEEKEVNQYDVLWIEWIINRKWCINHSQHHSCWRERNNQSVYRSWVHDFTLILRSCISLINEILHVLNKQLRFNYFSSKHSLFFTLDPSDVSLLNFINIYNMYFRYSIHAVYPAG